MTNKKPTPAEKAKINSILQKDPEKVVKADLAYLIAHHRAVRAQFKINEQKKADKKARSVQEILDTVWE